MKTLIVEMIFFATLTTALHCQEIPDAPSHKFFDRHNIAAFTSLGSAIAVDAVTTQRILENGGHESDPIVRTFLKHGTVGEVAVSSLSLGVAVAISYSLHRTNHHKLERALTWIAVAVESSNDARNIQQASKGRRR
jgi:hypothetical protein